MEGEIPVELLNAAVDYAGLGFKVFPLHSVSDGRCTCGYPCSSPGKHPRTASGVKDATTGVNQIRLWWKMWPDANIGIATGDGLVVLDADSRKGGIDSVRSLNLPQTLVAITGNGEHWYFRYTPERLVRCAVGVLPGIDIRGEGGYVVAPPSVHANGSAYAWDEGTRDLPLAEYPNLNWPTKEREDKPGEPISEGVRNATLASLAGSMRRRGLSEEAIVAALQVENQKRCDPPLSDAEVDNVARSISKYKPEDEPQFEIMARSAPEFIANQVPAPRFLVDRIWPEQTIGFIGGPAKVFKSFLAMEMAAAVATGRPFLGEFDVPAPRRVLLIQSESALGAYRERIKRIELRYGEARQLFIISNRPLTLDEIEDVDRLRLEIATLRPDLTILDPLSSFITGDENSAHEMGAVIRLLRNLRDEFSTSFAIVHHSSKGSEGGGEALRGTSAFYAACEVGLWVRRLWETGLRSTVRCELKDGEAVPTFHVELDSQTGLLSVYDPVAEQMERAFRNTWSDERAPEPIVNEVLL